MIDETKKDRKAGKLGSFISGGVGGRSAKRERGHELKVVPGGRGLSIDRPLPAPATRTGEYDENNRRYKKGQMYGQNRARQIVVEDLHPWERQPDETPEAYRAFILYRDLDPLERGYGAVAKLIHHSRTLVSRHGSNHHWIERASAWDFHIERARLAVTEKMQVEMVARHAGIAVDMLDKVKQKLAMVNFKKLSTKEMREWLEVGVSIERLSRGLSGGRVAAQFNVLNQNISANAASPGNAAEIAAQMTDAQITAELKKMGVDTSIKVSQKVLAEHTIDV